MKDQSKTKQVLIQELASLRQRISELERSESERKQVEEELRGSEERYRTLIETTRDLIYTTNRKGLLTYVNTTMERSLGYTHRELEGKSFMEIVVPECIDSVKDIFRRAMQGESIPIYEAVLIRKDGTRFSVEFNVVTLYDRDGNPSGRYGIGRDVTERKQAEEALRESEQRLHSIVDGSPIPAFVIGKDHRVIHWNKALEEMSRIKSEEIIGTREQWKAFYNEERPCMADLLVDEAVELVPQWYSGKYIKSPLIEGAYEATNFFPALGEEGKWLRFTAAAIRDSKGMLIGAVETLEDITDRKLAEETLRQSEEKYRMMLDNIQDGYYEVDLPGNLTFVNPSVSRILGYSEQELIGMNNRQYMDEENARKVFRAFNLVYKTEVPTSRFDWELIRKDGTKAFVGSSVSLIKDSFDKPVGFRGIIRDITDIKKAEEALRSSEEKYRELSIIDDLTQLYNSRYFYFQLKIEIDRSNRYEQPLTLLMIDLDNFKAFNDTYGHIEGDQVLLRFGQVVRRCLRQTDIAYRYGGEEFTILMPMTTSKGGAVTAERIRTEFKKENFSPVSGKHVYITVSIGLAQHKPQEDMKVFVNRVDQLMYQAKKTGKDRVCSD
jgi:diguanylate cyclase (GGDEF)-like protein/PAS domain S-box-containing protein